MQSTILDLGSVLTEAFLLLSLCVPPLPLHLSFTDRTLPPPTDLLSQREAESQQVATQFTLSLDKRGLAAPAHEEEWKRITNVMKEHSSKIE